MKMDLLNKITNRDLSKRLDEKCIYMVYSNKKQTELFVGQKDVVYIQDGDEYK